jgi:renalase
MTIAIIGAGMAGLACAEALTSRSHTVRLFDKGRGPGGRMSTRRVSTPLDDASFDHGAQYFTARDAEFAKIVADWEAKGVAAKWPQVSPDAWVGTPGMNAPVKHMAARHDVTWGCRVETLTRTKVGWTVSANGPSLGDYEAVILAIPAEQVGALVHSHAPEVAAVADATIALPCWTVMLAFENAIDTSTNTIRDAGPVGWAARNSAKPGRTGPEAWVIQASPEWSSAHLEDEVDSVTMALTQHWAETLGIAAPTPLSATAHRWRYARSGKAGTDALWDAGLKLGVCGDWLLGPRVECAWLSGTALGNRV